MGIFGEGSRSRSEVVPARAAGEDLPSQEAASLGVGVGVGVGVVMLLALLAAWWWLRMRRSKGGRSVPALWRLRWSSRRQVSTLRGHPGECHEQAAAAAKSTVDAAHDAAAGKCS